MAMLDIFSNKPAFSLQTLTESINKIPPTHSYLGDLGIFETSGVSNINLSIEERNGMLMLIPDSPRGAQGETVPREQRKVRPFRCSHKKVRDEILADQVLGVRMFGSESELETPVQKIGERLVDIRRSFEQTFEFMRVGACKGVVLDGDGKRIIYDFFKEFDVQQHTETWSFYTNHNDGTIKRKCVELRRWMNHVIGGTPYSGLTLLCGDEFYDTIIASDEFRIAYERYEYGRMLRESQFDTGLLYGGVNFWNYQGWVGDMSFIEPDVAYLVPRGVKGLFKQIYGPADYMETVNTVGIEYYAKQQVLPFNRGIELEVQSNPFFVCTRPGVLAKITLDPKTKSKA